MEPQSARLLCPTLTSWSKVAGPYRYELRSAGQLLHEPQPRTAAVRATDLELVGERLDDRDAEAAFGELVGLVRLHLVVLEPLAGVRHLDDEAIVVELVQDLHHPLAAVVGVSNRVRTGLGQCELQIGEHVLRKRAQAREARQREPPQRDVFRLRRNTQPDCNRLALPTHHRAPTYQFRPLSKPKLAQSSSSFGRTPPLQQAFPPRPDAQTRPRAGRA